MSFNVVVPKQPELVAAVENAAQQGIIMVASAGENDVLSSANPSFLYPAMYEQCISVGAMDQESESKLKTFNARLNYLMPFNEMWSTDLDAKNSYSRRKGSSMAAAIMTGICALIISQMDPQPVDRSQMKAEVQKLLMDTLLPIKDISYDTTNNITMVKV